MLDRLRKHIATVGGRYKEKVYCWDTVNEAIEDKTDIVLGVADDSTWLDNFPVHRRKNWPLLFDVNHNPKEAFYRIFEF